MVPEQGYVSAHTGDVTDTGHFNGFAVIFGGFSGIAQDEACFAQCGRKPVFCIRDQGFLIASVFRRETGQFFGLGSIPFNQSHGSRVDGRESRVIQLPGSLIMLCRYICQFLRLPILMGIEDAVLDELTRQTKRFRLDLQDRFNILQQFIKSLLCLPVIKGS